MDLPSTVNSVAMAPSSGRSASLDHSNSPPVHYNHMAAHQALSRQRSAPVQSKQCLSLDSRLHSPQSAAVLGAVSCRNVDGLFERDVINTLGVSG